MHQSHDASRSTYLKYLINVISSIPLRHREQIGTLSEKVIQKMQRTKEHTHISSELMALRVIQIWTGPAGIQISGHRSKFLIIKSLNSPTSTFSCMWYGGTASALTLCCHCGVCSSYQTRIIAQLTRHEPRAECVGYVSPNIVSVPGGKKWDR